MNTSEYHNANLECRNLLERNAFVEELRCFSHIALIVQPSEGLVKLFCYSLPLLWFGALFERSIIVFIVHQVAELVKIAFEGVTGLLFTSFGGFFRIDGSKPSDNWV